jgi:hypothetical protein
VIDADAVRRIAAIEDAVLRNVWITYVYSQLNTRVRRAAGFDRDHTWCGFATWASATAGRTIRRQDLPAVLVDILDASKRHRDGLERANAERRVVRALGAPEIETGDVLAALADALDDASAHVGHGNLVVFAELGPPFVAFTELVERDRHAVDASTVGAALESATGAPIADDLATAFGWYARAVAADDPGERARAMLAANVVAVSHEQRRLQDDIAAALVSGLAAVEAALDALAEDLRRRSRGPARLQLTSRIGFDSVRSVIVHAWDVAMTVMMMTLRVPGAELRLAEDVPPGPGGRLYPADLGELAGPPVVDPDAASVFAGWDRTQGTGRHDGARDWADLHQRMSYIVNLFRSRQQDESLGEAPFSDAQLADLRDGRMPPPPLLPPLHRRLTGAGAPEADRGC